MTPVCAACGVAQRERAVFCDACGEHLAPHPATSPGSAAHGEGEVKQVTIMFVDIVGSMVLAQRLGADAWRTLLEQFFRLASDAVHGVEGTVEKFTGDGIMAIFGAPLGQEDHARRACLAALRLHASLRPFEAELSSRGVELRIRVGVNSGEVIGGDLGEDLSTGYAVVGFTVGLAARLEAIAPPGSTAVSASTEALVRGEFELSVLHESLELHNSGGPQRVFELRGRGAARNRVDVQGLRGELSQLVGREDELAVLEAALERARAGTGAVIGLRGEPGIGKSRLVRELAQRCGREQIPLIQAQAEAHGRRTPLLPILALLRALLGIEEVPEPEQARARVAAAVEALDPRLVPELPLLWDLLAIPDAGAPAPLMDPEARARRIVRLVTGIVRTRSRGEVLVVVLEDLHWLDDASSALLDELLQALADARVLLVLTYRPEYAPARAIPELVLEPLPRAATSELVVRALGTHPSVQALTDSLVDQSGGNPFFCEELVQALLGSGQLLGRPGRRVLASPEAAVTLPDTVSATIVARIDALAQRDKDLLLVLSVIGESTDWRLVDAVRPEEGPGLVEALRTLVRGHLLVERLVEDRIEYAFRHPLIQEAAYRAQRSERRALTHARVADALVTVNQDRLDERAALLAHHCEHAGRLDDAAQWHARAATWISSTSPPAAMRHWQEARRLADALAPGDDVSGMALWARLGVLSQAWRLRISHELVDDTYREAIKLLAPADQQGMVRVLLDYAYSANLGFGGRLTEGLQVARENSRRAIELDDAGLIVLTAGAQWYGALTCGYLREGLEASTRALQLAGDDTRAGDVLSGALDHPYALCLLGRGYCAGFLGGTGAALRDISRAVQLARDEGNGEVEALALSSLAFIQAMAGWGEQALASAQASLETAERRGNAMGLMCGWLALVWAGTATGDRALTTRAARAMLDLAAVRGIGVELLTFAHSGLSWVALADGDVDAGLAAAELAVSESRRARPTWGELVARVRLGLALLADGSGDVAPAVAELDTAERLAREYEIEVCEPLLLRARAQVADRQGQASRARALAEQAERAQERLRLQ